MDGQLRSEEIVRSHMDRVCQEYCNYSGLMSKKSLESCNVLIPNDQPRNGDIGGDMNHVHRVRLKITSQPLEVNGEKDLQEESTDKFFSVIVKTAPREVRFLKRICGEDVMVDSQRIEFEAAALIKLFHIRPHCVPKVYLMDSKSKSIIMEDLTDYCKLEDKLNAGEIEKALSYLEGVMKCIGQVHTSTWLDGMEAKANKAMLTNFRNDTMKKLKAEFLLDGPFNSSNKSNRCNPRLLEEIKEFRTDPRVLSRVKTLRQSFLNQTDCLCHGDFSCSNILVWQNEFRIVDMEFAGVGLRAYDIALILEKILFHIFCQFRHGNHDRVKTLHKALHLAVDTYSHEVKAGLNSNATEPGFVEQVCGLMGCEQMWRVFGSYEMTEFGGAVEPELALLALAKSFLLCSDGSISISDNIDRHLLKHQLITS